MPRAQLGKEAATTDGSSIWPERLRALFEELVATEALGDGSRLPSERWLTERFQISRMTVRKALWQLEAEGVIYRFERAGWFLSPPRFRYQPTADVSFADAVRAQGRLPGTVVLERHRTPASKSVASFLGLARGEPIYLIRRLRLIDNRPVFVEISHVSAKLCPNLLDHVEDDVSLTSIYARHYRIRLRRRQVSMHPTALMNPHANDLRLAPGTPGLFLSRLTETADGGAPLTFDHELWRHDALVVEVKVKR